MATLDQNARQLKLLLGKFDLLDAITEPDLAQMDEKIAVHEEIIKLSDKLEKQQRNAAMTKAEKEAAERKAISAMDGFVAEFNIYYTATSGLWWWHEYGEWHSAKTPQFMEKFRGYLFNGDSYDIFQSEMDRAERKLNAAFYGWTDKPGYLNLMSMDAFCQPVQGDSYHPIFDLLFRSLGGGKTENIEHLEKLFLSKWQHPENYMLPCVVFGDGGGTGKSVLAARFCATLFSPNNVADNLSCDMAFGKFNARIAGMAFVFANEAPNDHEDDKGILRVIHSPTVNIEKKGRDPIPSCNTPLYMIGTNPREGGYAIRLAHSDVDRRFSIIHGKQPLKWHVAEFYHLSHDDDDAAGDAKMKIELQYVLSDATEVGRWLDCKQRQYGDIQHLRALHGVDYERQAADTLDMHLRVFENVFGAENFQYVRSEVLHELYKSKGGKLGPINFNSVARAYLEKHSDLDVHYERWPWNSNTKTQAAIFIRNKNKHLKNGRRCTLEVNDHDYGVCHDSGRWTFFVEII